MTWINTTLRSEFEGLPVQIWTQRPNQAHYHVIFFHGLFSQALPHQGKYGFLAQQLGEQHCTCSMITTARREVQAEDNLSPSTLLSAFKDKTFEQELSDVRHALALLNPIEGPTIFWGFSLGGLIASLLAPKDLFGLVLCGTGLHPSPHAQETLQYPIVQSLPPIETLLTQVAQAQPRFTMAFWGSDDQVFSQSSAHEAFDHLHVPQKKFIRCDGADHGFNRHNGKKTTYWLSQMAQLVLQMANQTTNGKLSQQPAVKKGISGH